MNKQKASKCYWLTGMSATGKSTLSSYLVEQLRISGRTTILLDGDELRQVLSVESYTREERIAIGMKYSRLCMMLVKQNVDVVIGVIALFKEIHRWNRKNIPDYVEVFVDTPLLELQRRDPKGIYQKVMNGEINNVAGVDMKVDFPENPDVHLCWEPGKTIEMMCAELLAQVIK